MVHVRSERMASVSLQDRMTQGRLVGRHCKSNRTQVLCITKNGVMRGTSWTRHRALHGVRRTGTALVVHHGKWWLLE